jgi:hypothetical protein
MAGAGAKSGTGFTGAHSTNRWEAQAFSAANGQGYSNCWERGCGKGAQGSIIAHLDIDSFSSNISRGSGLKEMRPDSRKTSILQVRIHRWYENPRS